jgi:hypothetical protein
MRDAEFVVVAGGQRIATFATDEHGQFRVVLPPGTYAVSTKGGKPGFGGCGPFEVEVVPGRLAQVNWRCESGLR